MRKMSYKRKFWLIPLGMIAFGALTGLVIMSLWNWIMPAVFGLGMITIWQALGMFILGRLLFGGFKKHRHWGMMKPYHYKYAYVSAGGNSCRARYGASQNRDGDTIAAE